MPNVNSEKNGAEFLEEKQNYNFLETSFAPLHTPLVHNAPMTHTALQSDGA